MNDLNPPPRFEVGSRVTWTEWVSDAEDPRTGKDYIAQYKISGTVKRLTPHMAIIEIDTEGWDDKFQPIQTPYEKKVSKSCLASDVHSLAMREAVVASIGVASKPSDDTLYVIYRLSCNGITHYVGISKNVKLRYKQHCQCQGLNLELNLWIQGLLREGYTPQIDIIEENIRGAIAAQDRESYWIQHYLDQGAPLKNRAKVDRGMAS